MSIPSTGASDVARAAYSVTEAAAQLGVSEVSIWRALKRGELEAVRFGGRRLIPARSIENLLSAKAAA